MELLRDPIRLSFAFLGPLLLMLAFGFGISFDVEKLKFAAYDQDNSMESGSLSRPSPARAILRAGADPQPGRARRAPAQRRAATRDRDPSFFGRDLMSRRCRSSRSCSTGRCRSAPKPPRLRHRLAAQYAQSFAASRRRPATWRRRSRSRPLSLQPGLQERQRDGASVIMLMLILIRRSCRRSASSGEGNRLDRQFPLDADQPLRIPVRKQLPYIAVAMGSFAM